MRANITWAGLALSTLLALSGCGKSSPKCDASNCGGCCDAAGICQVPDATHCGLRGAACAPCGGGQCNAGVCQAGTTSSTTSASTGATAASSGASSGATSGAASSAGSTGASGSATGSTGGPAGSTGTSAATIGSTGSVSTSATVGSTGSVSTTGTVGGSTGTVGTSGSATGSTGGTTGAPGTAVVTPSALDFRGVALNAPQQRDLTVTNSGPAGSVLTITAVDVVPGAGSAAGDFTAQVAPGGPASLPAGGRADVVVTATGANVGARTATVVVHTNDPATPTWQIPVQASVQQQPACHYSVSPATLDFGQAEPNVDHLATFRITNTSSNSLETCRLSAIDLAWASVGGAFHVQNGPIDATLAAGASLDVGVIFHPTTPGATYDGDVRFFTSSTSAPQGAVHLHGQASTTCLQVGPASLDLGQVEQGCEARPAGIVVSNICTQASESLTAVDLASAGACPDGGPCTFTLTGVPALPHTLSPGQAVVLSLAFRPASTGPASTSVTVTAQGEAPVVVPVSGQGTATASQTDTFAPPSSNKVDVLLVVDDSCSMTDKQQALGANFGAFIQPALDAGVDFHLAVTTTTTLLETSANCTSGSPAPCGLFAPADGSRPQVLTPQTPNLAQVFDQNVNVGVNGSPVEMGLEAAYEALSPPNLGGANAAFLRPDARLAVVVVSDASDQSGRPADFYFNYFLNLKAGAPAPGFTLSAVTSLGASPPAGAGSCYYDGTNDVPNPYVAMSQLTGGAVEEICSGNWAQMLGEVGSVTFGAAPTISRLPLSRAADPAGSFAVAVNGVPLQPGRPDGGSNWAYDPNANAIEFSPPQPVSASTVAVSYDRACVPPPLGSYDAGSGTTGGNPLSGGEGGYAASLAGGAGYSPLDGGTRLSFTAADDGMAQLPLPPGFDFRWYGQPVSTIYVGTNGFIAFDAAQYSLCSTTTCAFSGPLPVSSATSNPVDSLYVWWDDLNLRDGGMSWGYEDVGGEQALAVDYHDVSYYSGGGVLSAKVRLYPASSRIEVVYGSNTDVNGGGVAGVQNGAAGAQASYTAGLACSTAAGGCPASAWPTGSTLTYDYLGNALFGAGEFTVASASVGPSGGALDVYLYEGNDAPGCLATSPSGGILHLGMVGASAAGQQFDVDAGTAHVELLWLYPDGGQQTAAVSAGVIALDGLQPDGGANGRFSAAVTLPGGAPSELHGTFFAPSCH